MATILVVDDRTTNREFLVTLLGYHHHNLLQAADGAEALAVARAYHPDLVITDVLMPTMDGYAFMGHLRADPTLAHTPVIFYTAAYLEREARALAHDCGVEYVLAKPTEAAIIVRTVTAALGQASGRSPPHEAPLPDTFDREHLRLLTDKLSHEVNELEAVNSRLAALIDVSQRLASERDPLRLLTTYCHVARTIVSARYAAIGVLEDDGSALRHYLTSGAAVHTDDAAAPPPRSESLLSRLLTQRSPLRLHCLDGDIQALGFPAGHPPIASFLGIPIASPTRVYGWLALADKHGAEEFGAEDEQIAMTLGGLMALAYENARRYEALQQHATALEQEVAERVRAEEMLRQYTQRLKVLHAIDQAILAVQSPEAIAQATLRHIRQLIPCRHASVVGFDLSSGEAIVWAIEQSGDAGPQPGPRLPQEGLLRMDALRQGQPLVVEDLRDPRLEAGAGQLLETEGLRSAITVPIISQGNLIGALNLASESPGAFPPNSVEIAREIGDQLAVAIQNAQLFEQVRIGRERLQILSRQLVCAQEDERRRLARELHDEIGQALTAAQLNLQTLLGLPDPAMLPARLEDSLTLIDRVLQQVRALSLDLRPSMLDDLGLVAALRWYTNRQAERAGLVVSFVADPPSLRLTSEIETTCFRIAQEAMTNIIRHARAQRVSIELRRRDSELRLVLRDDGVGFDSAAARNRAAHGASLGLVGMQERALLVGGQVTIESAPGQGTEVLARFPLSEASDRPVERRKAAR